MPIISLDSGTLTTSPSTVSASMVRELMTPSFLTENAYCDIGPNGHHWSLPTHVPRQTVVTTAAVVASRHSTEYGPSVSGERPLMAVMVPRG
ncbi:hypothetical protein GCM10025782_30290 [Pedococcus ginsenosidimutans]|uniref:Uncharacterized protein n=1 Tax=Pedococcus ginsenosidimutans TaxID=490570 RepID=A0ABP8YHV7_9MICO